jgi:hypothetical protein
MTPDQALENISGLLGDYGSFCSGFGHDDHGDDDTEDDCRFDQYDIDESLKAIADLIDASKAVVEVAKKQGVIDG